MRLLRHLMPPLAFALLLANAATGQDADSPVTSWTRIEGGDEMREYQAKLKKKDGFDDAARGFLETTVLPQLAAEKNRSTIERIRRRIREVALSERDADATALDLANDAAARGLTGMARNGKLDPLVRINAMLLVGELRGRDGRPWPAAAAPLATVVADASLPMAVRVAATAGLARHAESARAAGSADPAFQTAVAEQLTAVLATPPKPADGPGGDWLLSRVLEIMPVGVTTAPPTTAKHLTAILGDASRPTDVRVRAAAALGATAAADSAVDAAALVGTIRECAVAALEADRAAAEERAIGRKLGGQPGFGMPGGAGEFGGAGKPAGDAATLDTLVVRRDAWRLATLANAVQPAEGGGLASLIPAAGRSAAQTLATTLREAAQSLDRFPDMDTLAGAIDSLGKAARPEEPVRPAKPAAAEPAEPTGSAPAASDPFATPGS